MAGSKAKNSSSSSQKKTSPSKFKMGTAKTVSKRSKDQSIYTFCGKPGFATAFAIKHTGEPAYIWPFQQKVNEGDSAVEDLKIIAVVNRILEGTQNPVTSSGYNVKQFLRQVNSDNMEEIIETTEKWGRDMADVMNACNYTYPTHFVYRGDISGIDGKDIKNVVQEGDVRTFVRQCFREHLNNLEFFEDSSLMEAMFDETNPDTLMSPFSGNPDNL